MHALGLSGANLRYYSLRRGGATKIFNETGSFDACAEAGRWASIRTARIYIDAALQTEYSDVAPSTEKRIQKAREVFKAFVGLRGNQQEA